MREPPFFINNELYELVREPILRSCLKNKILVQGQGVFKFQSTDILYSYFEELKLESTQRLGQKIILK